MELLAGSHRHCILELCTAHLDDVLELLSLGLERCDKVLESLLKIPVHADKRITES